MTRRWNPPGVRRGTQRDPATRAWCSLRNRITGTRRPTGATGRNGERAAARLRLSVTYDQAALGTGGRRAGSHPPPYDPAATRAMPMTPDPVIRRAHSRDACSLHVVTARRGRSLYHPSRHQAGSLMVDLVSVHGGHNPGCACRAATSPPKRGRGSAEPRTANHRCQGESVDDRAAPRRCGESPI